MRDESFVLPSRVFLSYSRATHKRRVKRSDRLRLVLTERMRMRLPHYRDNFEQFKKAGEITATGTLAGAKSGFPIKLFERKQE